MLTPGIKRVTPGAKYPPNAIEPAASTASQRAAATASRMSPSFLLQPTKPTLSKIEPDDEKSSSINRAEDGTPVSTLGGRVAIMAPRMFMEDAVDEALGNYSRQASRKYGAATKHTLKHD